MAVCTSYFACRPSSSVRSVEGTSRLVGVTLIHPSPGRCQSRIRRRLKASSTKRAGHSTKEHRSGGMYYHGRSDRHGFPRHALLSSRLPARSIDGNFTQNSVRIGCNRRLASALINEACDGRWTDTWRPCCRKVTRERGKINFNGATLGCCVCDESQQSR